MSVNDLYRRIRRKKYFLSIILLSFLIFLIFTLTVLYISFVMYHEEAKNKSLEAHLSRLDTYANQFNLEYNKIVSSAEQLSIDPNILKWINLENTDSDLYLTKIILNKLKHVSVINNSLYSLELYNARSNTVLSHYYGYYSINHYNEMFDDRKELYREFMNNNRIRHLTMINEKNIHISTPIIIQMNSIPTYSKTGAIGMGINPSKLLPQNVVPTENLIIIDRKDPTLFFSTTENLLLPEDKIKQWFRELLEHDNQNVMHEISIDGKIYYSGFKNVLNNELKLLMLVPEVDILVNLKSFSEYFKMAFILLLMLCIFSSFIIYIIAYQPIKNIAETVKNKIKVVSKNDIPNSGDHFTDINQTFELILNKNTEIEETVRKHKGLIKENTLRNLIYGKNDEKDLLFYRKSYLFKEENNFLILIFNIDSRNQEKENHVNLDFFFDGLGKSFDVSWLRTGYRQYTILFNLNNDHELENVLEQTRVLQEQISKKYNNTLTVGVSSFTDNINKISLCYNEALKALKYKTLLGNNRIIQVSQIQNKVQSSNSFSVQDGQLLITKLRTVGEAEISCNLINMIDNKSQQYSIELLTAYLLYISSCIVQVGIEYNIGLDTMVDSKLFRHIIENDTLDEIKEYLANQCKIIVEARDSEQNHFKKVSLDVAIQYINSNYHKPISLESVASEINISSSYLSRLMKQETGINFNKYLNKLRVDNAIHLLADDNLTVKEISATVGYYNEHTFIRNFKNFTGRTPTTYRNTQ